MVAMGGFITYILLLAPPLHLQETLTLLQNLLTGQWADITHYPVLILLVGIWLLIYSCLLFIDGRMQDPFLAVCLSLSGDRRNWSDALFSYAGSKSTVFWAKDAFQSC